MREIKVKKKETQNGSSKRRKEAEAKDMSISDSCRADIIKRAIEEGTYIVKSEDIAMKIVQKMKDRFFYKIS